MNHLPPNLKIVIQVSQPPKPAYLRNKCQDFITQIELLHG